MHIGPTKNVFKHIGPSINLDNIYDIISYNNLKLKCQTFKSAIQPVRAMILDDAHDVLNIQH